MSYIQQINHIIPIYYNVKLTIGLLLGKVLLIGWFSRLAHFRSHQFAFFKFFASSGVLWDLTQPRCHLSILIDADGAEQWTGMFNNIAIQSEYHGTSRRYIKVKHWLKREQNQFLVRHFTAPLAILWTLKVSVQFLSESSFSFLFQNYLRVDNNESSPGQDKWGEPGHYPPLTW